VQVDGAEALEHLPENASIFESLEGFGGAEFVEKNSRTLGENLVM